MRLLDETRYDWVNFINSKLKIFETEGNLNVWSLPLTGSRTHAASIKRLLLIFGESFTAHGRASQEEVGSLLSTTIIRI